MASQSTLFPVLLMPLKLETRFIKNIGTGSLELWVRIFPDVIFLNSFNRDLTLEEKEDHDRFLGAKFEVKQNSVEQENGAPSKEVLWQELVAKYGAYRAQWVIRPQNFQLTEDESPEKYIFEWLPTSFRVYLYNKDGSLFKSETTTINKKKLSGLGENLSEGNSDEWITYFKDSTVTQDAIDTGMGVIIDLLSSKELDEIAEFSIHKIVVVGINDVTGEESTASFEALLEQHNHTYGFSILDYGTATNNTNGIASGYNSQEEFDAIGSFDHAVQGMSEIENIPFFSTQMPIHFEDSIQQDAFNALKEKATQLDSFFIETSAKTLSKALGIENSTFKYIKNANGQQSSLYKLIQRAIWFALGGQSLDLLFGQQISPDDHQWIWEHYSEQVSPSGALPSIRIGEQPYGILPVTKLRWDNISTNDTQEESRSKFLNNLCYNIKRKWLPMVEKSEDSSVPHKTHEGLSDVELFQIMTSLPASEKFQLGVYQMPRIQGLISPFVEEIANFPINLSSLSISQVYQLLSESNHEMVKKEQIEVYLQKLRELGEHENNAYASLFTDAILNQLRDSAQLGFEGITPYQITDQSNDNTLDANTVKINHIPLEKDWFLGDFFDFSCRINGIEPPIDLNTDGNNEIIGIYHDSPSVLTDLLYRSYENACQLYNKKVVFQPSTNDLKRIQGYSTLVVDEIKISDDVSVVKGDVVIRLRAKNIENTTTDSFIDIKAPFDGVVTIASSLEKGQQIKDAGVFLFHIINQEQHQNIKQAHAHTFAGIIMACQDIEDDDERQNILHKALANGYDVNSYRVDAWMSSLANKQLTDMRKSHPDGLYYGAYGYLENLILDTGSIAETDTMLDPNVARGGIIHAPTPAQSTATAILKNAFLNQLDLGEEENPFTLKLTSDRIQKSKDILDGVRQDQAIEALLGYQLERYLHEHIDRNLHPAIFKLRQLFPLEVNIKELGASSAPMTQLAVINGLEILAVLQSANENGATSEAQRREYFANYINVISKESNSNDTIPKIEARLIFYYVLKLEDSLDGVLDVLFYEAGYQIINGNMTRAAAAMDAYKGTGAPPEIDALNTRISGTSITHRFAMVLSSGESAGITSVRAFLEPNIENWLKKQMGSMEKISCHVQLTDPNTGGVEIVPFYLKNLNISYSDLLYWSDEPLSDGQRNLESRIWSNIYQADLVEDVIFKILPTQKAEVNHISLSEYLSVFRYAYRMFSKASVLHSEDLQYNTDEIKYDWGALDDILNKRILPLLVHLVNPEDTFSKTVLGDQLLQTQDTWYQQLGQENVAFLCAQFNFEEAKKSLIPDQDYDLAILQTEIQEKVTIALKAINTYQEEIASYKSANTFTVAFELLEKAVKVILGNEFILLPPALPSVSMAAILKAPEKQKLLVGEDLQDGQLWGQERIQEWIQGIAQVKTNTQTFEDWQMMHQLWSEKAEIDTSKTEFLIIQEPTILSYPWVGLNGEEIRELLEIHGNLLSSLPDGELYPDGSDSLVIYKIDGEQIKQNEPIYGLLIEAFSEQIPDKEVTTGITFQYDAPNTEAPQSLLLVTPWAEIRAEPESNTGKPWKVEHLRDAVLETMDLAKIRMLDLESITDYGFVLPFAHWLNIPTKS